MPLHNKVQPFQITDYPHDNIEEFPPVTSRHPSKDISPGYYQALDYDGECHLYPIIDDDAETQRQLSDQMRAVWGALCLHQTYLMHTLKTSLVTPRIINAGRKLQAATICGVPCDRVGSLEYAKPSEKVASTLDQTNDTNAEKLQQAISRFKESLFNCRFKGRCHRCKESGHTRSKCTKIK